MGRPGGVVVPRAVHHNRGQSAREHVLGVATRKDTSNGTLDNLAQVPALFIDWDCSPADAHARLEGFPFPVSLLVESGLGLHGYWLLKEPIDLGESGTVHYTASLLRRLAAYLGGDDRATDPARVRRLPGTCSFSTASRVPSPWRTTTARS